MASKFGTVWAVDVGNNSLKALHVSTVSGTVEVIGFDNIEHSKILTGDGVTATERDELVALSLRRLIEQNDLGKDDIVVSVPSQNSFARFVNLPPVEPKRIPEIVKFEAAQQIPFDINDVQWDWQLMTEAGGSETRVGIFAVKNDVVDSVLEHFSREDVTVSYVQMAPMALYNYVLYDRADVRGSENQAIVVLDIGAENTDLVVCTSTAVWQRCVPMGGNAFTRAIADAFKLSFQRAEKLKRTAPMSKYARQIYQAMRPVFTDLASEIQRSLNFYTSSNPDTKLTKVIALGGGTKMRGLLKYLRQSLQIPVEKPDAFKKLAMGPGIAPAKFHENVSDFGIVYGLALQGLGLGGIESNLLPRTVARSMAWSGKAKYFTGAACLLLLVSLMCFARTSLDGVSYNNKKNNRYRQETKSIINDAEQARTMLREVESRGAGCGATIKKAFAPFAYRDVVPLLHQTIISTLPNEENNPEQAELYKAFAEGDVRTVLKFPRRERKQIFVTGMSVRSVDDVETATLRDVDFVTGKKRKGPGGRDLDERHLAELAMKGTSRYLPARLREKAERVEEDRPGFVVTIEGYSPYKQLRELMDPAEAGDDGGKCGIVTRLLRLEDTNSPFMLYKKTDPGHFKLETGAVSVDAKMPIGIGVVDVRFEQAEDKKTVYGASGEHVIVDPMMKEVISKVTKSDGQEEFNDHWFVLKLKLIWKDAPKSIKPIAPPAGGRTGRGGRVRKPPAPG